MSMPQSNSQSRPASGRPTTPSRLGSRTTLGLADPIRAEPFRSAEDAWFWTMAALTARREGARFGANRGLVRRPCDPDDVVKCLDMLYRRRRIDLVHARILRIWGERQTAPNPAYAAERCDARFWREALNRLEWPLRVKGIVA
jgi:hypothetical protein